MTQFPRFLLDRFLNPHPRVTDPENLQQSRLLSAILLVLLLVGVLILTLVLHLDPNDIKEPTVQGGIILSGIIVGMYVANRLGYTRLAAAGVILPFVGIFIYIPFFSGEAPLFLAFLVVPIILTAIFFSFRWTAFVSVAILAMVLVLISYQDQVSSTSPIGNLRNLWYFLTLATGLVLTFMWHLGNLEAIRQRELKQTNERLEQDIALRLRAEEALRDSELRLRHITDKMLDVISQTDAEGLIQYISPSSHIVLGYRPEALRGHPVVEFVHPDDLAGVITALRTGLDTSTAGQVEFRYRHADGHYLWLEAVGNPLSNDAGQIEGVVIAARDITMRKQAEAALRESEERFRSLSEAAFEGIMIHEKGVILDANQTFANICGFSHPGELIGKNGLEVLPFTPESREVVRSRIQEGTSETYEITLRRGDGSIFPAETQARDITYQGRKARVVAMRDITERKQAEAALQRYSARMEILHEIDRAILTARSPEETALAAVTRIRELVPCRRASVNLFDFQIQGAILLAVSVNGTTRLSPGPGISLEAFGLPAIEDLKHGQAHLIEDMLAITPPSEWDQQFIAEGMRAWLSTPLLYRGELIGALNLSRGEPGPFSREDIEIAREVADPLAIAIQQARLLTETTEALAREQRLNEVARAISSTLDLPTALSSIVRLAVELVGAESGVMGLIAPDGQTLTHPYLFNLSEELGLEQPIPKGSGIAWQVIETRRAVLLADYGAHPEALPHWVAAGIHSFLEAPLVAGEICLGILGLYILSPARRFSERDLALAESVGRQAGIAIQNARLFESEKRRVALLTALHETGLDLSAQLDLPALLETIIRRATHLLDAPRGTLYLLQPDGQTLEEAVGHNLDPADNIKTLRLGEGLSGRVTQTGEPMVVADYTQWPGRVASTVNLPYRSMLAVPIKWQGRVLGTIGVLDDRPARFGPDAVELIRLFADQAAIAIQNARLFEATRQQVAHLTVLHAVALAGAEARDEDNLIERAVQIIHEELYPDILDVLLVDQSAGVLRPHPATRSVGDEAAQLAIPLGKGIVGRVAAQGEPLRLADVRREPAYLAVNPDIRSELCVPLKTSDHVIGVFNVESNRLGAFSEADERLLMTFASQLATAIEKLRLFEAEKRRVALLTALHETGLDLSAQLDLPTLLQTIMGRAARLLNAPMGGLYLLRPDGQFLEPVANLPPEDIGQPVHIGEGLVGRVAETGAPLVIADYSQWAGRLASLTNVPFRAVVGVPIKWQEKALGVVSVCDIRPGRFGSDDAEIVRLFAAQAAVAIQNARLFEQVSAGREQLQALSHRLVEVQEEERRHIARELHDEIGQTLTGLKLVLQVIPRLPAEAAAAKLKDALQLVNELMERAHNLSLDLRPAMLDDLGLPAALMWLFERYQTQTGVHVAFEFARLEERLAPEVETTAYRIVQEALTNVARHAQVKEVAVWLLATDEALRIQIRDEGPGFDVPAALAAGKRAGVTSMKERATLLGGWLKVDSAPGSGTQVIASLPLYGRLERRKYDRLNSVGG